MRQARKERRSWPRSSESPASASPGSAWELRETWTGSPRHRWHRGRCLADGDGVADWAWRRWCACAPASSRRRLRSRRSRSCGPWSRSISRIRTNAGGSSPGLRICWLSPSGRTGSRGSLLPPGGLLRAAGGGRSGRPGPRRSSMGGRRAPRLHRVPARVVARRSDLRAGTRASGATSSGDPGSGREGGFDHALGGAAFGTGDGSADSRASSRDLRGLASGDPRARRGRAPVRSRRWCGCRSTGDCSHVRTASDRLAGPIDALDVPESLHALIAARPMGSAPTSAAAPGRIGAREIIHHRRPGGAGRAGGGRAPALSLPSCGRRRFDRGRPRSRSAASTASSRIC